MAGRNGAGERVFGSYCAVVLPHGPLVPNGNGLTASAERMALWGHDKIEYLLDLAFCLCLRRGALH